VHRPIRGKMSKSYAISAPLRTANLNHGLGEELVNGGRDARDRRSQRPKRRVQPRLKAPSLDIRIEESTTATGRKQSKGSGDPLGESHKQIVTKLGNSAS